MLPKANRVDKKTIDQIFTQGRFLSSATLHFKYLKTGSRPRISFIAPKSMAKLAIKRNALRRLGYAALEKTAPPGGIAGVFIFKRYENDTKKLGQEIETIFSKIGHKAD